MSELRPELLALLERAREAHDPGKVDEDRVHAALAAALAAPLAAASTGHAAIDPFAPATQSAAPAVQASASGSGAWLAAKLVVGLAVGTLGVWSALPSPGAPASRAHRSLQARGAAHFDAAKPRRDESALQATPIPERAQTAQAAALPAEPPSAAQPEPVAADLTPRIDTSVARRHRRSGSHAIAARSDSSSSGEVSSDAPSAEPLAPAGEPAAVVAAVPEPQAEALGSARTELQLIRAALGALSSHHPEQALALLRRHRAEHPQGVMSEEREGLWSVALCQAGQREEGKAAGQRFAERAPHSPLLERIRSACQIKE